MKTAKQIFDFLPGAWEIARNIVSQVSSECHKASGYGAFVISKDEPNLILYSEKVTVSNFPINTSAIGTQKYQYKYDINRSSISKYFSDGRFFYELNILNDKADGEHLCVQDKYKASYVFGESQFSLTYSVDGPSKRYDIITEYNKISPEDVSALGITIENGEVI